MEKASNVKNSASFTQLSYEVSKLVDSSACEDDRAIRHDDIFSNMTEQEMVDHFYEYDSDQQLASRKPWKADSYYFKEAYVSSLALTKMSAHARSGGSIEIMGMLTGKIFDHCIVVMDSYPLPVEGTETRVNAQSEGYEFMVQYLDALKETGRNEDIVGWYHSHPGYGCWLSGIDVATQALNQQFQDPYLAIVVDPERTIANEKIEIGAFRTLPVEKNKKDNGGNKNFGETRVKAGDVPDSKLSDFGVHHDRYYSLDVKIFQSKMDKLWMDSLFNNQSSQLVNKKDRDLVDKETDSTLSLAKGLNDYKIPTVVVNMFSSAESQKHAGRHSRHNHPHEQQHHHSGSRFPMEDPKWHLGHSEPSSSGFHRRLPPGSNRRGELLYRRSEFATYEGRGDVSKSYEPDDNIEDKYDSDEDVAEADDSDGGDEQLDDSDIDISNNSNDTNGDESSGALLLGEKVDSHAAESSDILEKRQNRPIPPAMKQVRKHTPEQIRQISNEISRIFKQPPMKELDSEAGKLAVSNLIQLLTLNVQKELFSD